MTFVADAGQPPAVPEEAELPPELQASVRRHEQHLNALVASLRAAGVDEGVIEASVHDLVESYGAELTAALRTLVLERADV